MIQVNLFEHKTMGQYVRDYQPRVNPNTLINSLVRLGTTRLLVATRVVIVTEKKYPDVSFWQGEIDWDVMRSQTDTVIIREGQNEWTDPQFVRNWREAKARGMYRGAYSFYDDRVSPAKQAERIARNLENDLPEMEFVMDWEHNFGGHFQGIRNVVACMQRVEELLPGIIWKFYTGYYFFTSNTNAITHANQYNYLRTKRLWLAWYTENFEIIRVPNPWTVLSDLQFGTPPEGQEYGCDTIEIDMNWFNGTNEQFYNRYGGIVPPEPPDTGEPPMRYYNIVGAGNFNIRAGTSTSSQDIGDLWEGDKVEVSQVVDVSANDHWGKLAKITRVSGTETPLPAPVCYISLNTTRTVEYFPEPPTNENPITDVHIKLATGSVVTTTRADGSQEVETA